MGSSPLEEPSWGESKREEAEGGGGEEDEEGGDGEVGLEREREMGLRREKIGGCLVLKW